MRFTPTKPWSPATATTASVPARLVRAQHVRSGAVEDEGGAVRGEGEETEIDGGLAARQGHGEGGEGGGVAAKPRGLEGDAAPRVAVEGQVEGVEAGRGIARV